MRGAANHCSSNCLRFRSRRRGAIPPPASAVRMLPPSLHGRRLPRLPRRPAPRHRRRRSLRPRARRLLPRHPGWPPLLRHRSRNRRGLRVPPSLRRFPSRRPLLRSRAVNPVFRRAAAGDTRLRLRRRRRPLRRPRHRPRRRPLPQPSPGGPAVAAASQGQRARAEARCPTCGAPSGAEGRGEAATAAVGSRVSPSHSTRRIRSTATTSTASGG